MSGNKGKRCRWHWVHGESLIQWYKFENWICVLISTEWTLFRFTRYFLSLLKWKLSNIKSTLCQVPWNWVSFAFPWVLVFHYETNLHCLKLCQNTLLTQRSSTEAKKNGNWVCIAVFNLGRVFASLTRNVIFSRRVKFSWSLTYTI